MAKTGMTERHGGGPVVVRGDAKHPDDGKFTLFQACALNTLNMFGTGPFITIPILLSQVSPAGPHALIGYAAAAFFCVNDSLVWGELGSMWPTSGGTCTYLNELYGKGPEGYGPFMAYMFVWQFMLSGPLEVASGFVAIGEYFTYITGEGNPLFVALTGMGFGILTMALLYRDIADVSNTTVVLWLGTVIAILFTVIIGWANADMDNFSYPKDALSTSGRVVRMLAVSTRVGIYDFTGYYDINFIGDEVVNPSKVIPRACVFTCCVVSLIFFAVYTAVIASIPWDGEDGFVTLYNQGQRGGSAIMGLFCERLVGQTFAFCFVLVVMVTIFGSCFSLLLGYASIPMVAGRDGHFFKWFDHEHPTNRGLADRSLLVFGTISCLCCLLPLSTLVEALLTTRLALQYVAQALGAIYYRRCHPNTTFPWTAPLYPLPHLICTLGFSFVFFTTPNYIISGETPILDLALLFLLVGAGLYPLKRRATLEPSYHPAPSESSDASEEGEDNNGGGGLHHVN